MDYQILTLTNLVLWVVYIIYKYDQKYFLPHIKVDKEYTMWRHTLKTWALQIHYNRTEYSASIKNPIFLKFMTEEDEDLEYCDTLILAGFKRCHIKDCPRCKNLPNVKPYGVCRSWDNHHDKRIKENAKVCICGGIVEVGAGVLLFGWIVKLWHWLRGTKPKCTHEHLDETEEVMSS